MQRTVDAIRDWFRECPEILKGNRFGVDHLSYDPTEYAIYMSPSSISSYVDVTGDVCVKPIQELNFMFASREKHTSDWLLVRSLLSAVLISLRALHLWQSVQRLWLERRH